LPPNGGGKCPLQVPACRGCVILGFLRKKVNKKRPKKWLKRGGRRGAPIEKYYVHFFLMFVSLSFRDEN
jgi:hypothetical protein